MADTGVETLLQLKEMREAVEKEMREAVKETGENVKKEIGENVKQETGEAVEKMVEEAVEKETEEKETEEAVEEDIREAVEKIREAVEKEIEEGMDNMTLGSPAQPAAPQALPKPAAITLLRLRRTFACTDLLRLSLAQPQGPAHQEGTPGPNLHPLCPEDSTQPCTLLATQDTEHVPVQLQQEDSSPLPCPVPLKEAARGEQEDTHPL
ncbi:proline-, glutamic acid- and leucine-rich protein 1-like [Apus apus]|uniref:proline-, glutamic acid- and leucine-rich protein 1-like n=1 Tax=Apus apus TaxID=8895 RepID=UPI0021F87B31|nr:proline-, glutamic acid- and leucine-rich protein 1-like [Apus apus]